MGLAESHCCRTVDFNHADRYDQLVRNSLLAPHHEISPNNTFLSQCLLTFDQHSTEANAVFERKNTFYGNGIFGVQKPLFAFLIL
jgi:hypothetical protein